MRTTINLDDALLQQAKALAQRSGTTVTALIEDSLRERLVRRAPVEAPAAPFRLHTFTGKGLQPGVDLDNSAGLRDLMDDPA